MLGHEGSGIVLEIGPKVKKVKPKDRVVLHWIKGSGIQSDTPIYYSGKKELMPDGLQLLTNMLLCLKTELQKLTHSIL